MSIREESVQELLDTIVTVVDERRHKHSQMEEAAKRDLYDASEQSQVSDAGRRMDLHNLLKREYESLVAEIKEVIEA